MVAADQKELVKIIEASSHDSRIGMWKIEAVTELMHDSPKGGGEITTECSTGHKRLEESCAFEFGILTGRRCRQITASSQ